VAGDSLSVYDVLRALIRATPVGTKSPVTECDCLDAVDMAERLHLFGEVAAMAEARVLAEKLQRIERENDERRKNVRQVRGNFF